MGSYQGGQDAVQKEILVKSCRQFKDRRRAIDVTWADMIRHRGVCVSFIVGGYERERYRYAVCEVSTGDKYEHNSMKLKHALQMRLERSDFDYIFICDDDTYIHPARWLEHEPKGDVECRIFTPTRARQREERPWIHGGPGWWMSRNACVQYVTRVDLCCSWDDKLMGHMALDLGLLIEDRRDLYGGDHYSHEKDRVGKNNTFISCHPVRPNEMRMLHKELHDVI